MLELSPTMASYIRSASTGSASLILLPIRNESRTRSSFTHRQAAQTATCFEVSATTDDILRYVECRLIFAVSSCLYEIDKNDNRERIIASIEITYPHDLERLNLTPFWHPGIFLRDFNRQGHMANS